MGVPRECCENCFLQQRGQQSCGLWVQTMMKALISGLEQQDIAASERFRVQLTCPNPALTKALTKVLARFWRAESTAAAPAGARPSARCSLYTYPGQSTAVLMASSLVMEKFQH